ncbi:Uncharacterized protein APZ42_025109 [Daphnia magna]|uniref:Uncharacterized protein n=1 Tax=Daphnia magna TaxID=35525 RepID=A0A164TH46_9CRUS|nr:Uncharacterized protein APZ42_025109 [Daphnia magna]
MAFRIHPTHHFVNKFRSKPPLLIAKTIRIILAHFLKFEPVVISDVDTEFQVPLSKLLNGLHELFASKDSELGNTNLIKHTIDTQGRGPLRQRPYRVKKNQIQLLK